ncbi:NAD(P)-dependent dehydrogenase, short-chain alcohol dehydrogenase family [Arboricoccus pini]|uniref:NAD(P)-dependent dehydrogenase, short-chain alcohol dehydrogenase family n=1 Tax=Arboricoccus pini TaxID=1963835 RepID=A0A212RDE0_9PROT|nr:SDR family oxidoreductase [Arboricoccus pini]SNB70320.1 NAD(P)-dependent dehydrogenase, short-chain alcohol dehydrogenase family [Arboricoccus pini]
MHIDLSGKHALVTGSTAGIGYGIARGLAKSGAIVTLNGRSEARVKEATARLQADLPDADISGIAADVGTKEGCQALAQAVGEVDILINNAGIFEPTPFFEIPDGDWEEVFRVNVMSGVRMATALAPAMQAKGWGRIIFISSESAINIPTEMVHYGMSKTAQLAVSRGLAQTLAGSGITVNSVLPGPTMSEGVEAMFHQIAKTQGKSFEAVAAGFVKEHRPSSLIGRVAEVEEVAAMVVYLSSPQASATTGAALRVEGGIVQSIA